MMSRKEDRNYVLTNNWLGGWEVACDRCGESNAPRLLSQGGTLAGAFAHIWKHRNCQGEVQP